MANELSVRLTADIANLQSALTKAKNTIRDFEKSTEKESEKSNVGFRRKIGLIEALTNKSKQLRVALSQATNENDIERYNQELEQTIKEMTRLNALGRQVTNSLAGANSGFNQATQSIGSANGVALEFNRIIQDAPFGIIGIGNNLQQLAGNFAAASKQAGGAGKAIAASLSALVSPANLALLGISAITAAFTAYQMGAFDAILGNEEVEDSFENLNDEIDKTISSLSRVEKTFLDGAKGAIQERVQLDSLFATLQDTNISQETRVGAYNKLISLYPNLLKGLSQEKALTGDLTSEYNLLSEAIGKKALAEASQQNLTDLYKEQLDIQQQRVKEENTEFEIQKRLFNIREQIRSGEVKGSGVAKGKLAGLRNEEKSLVNQLELQRQIVKLNDDLLTAQGTQAEQLKIQLVDLNKELAELFGFGGSGQSSDAITVDDIFSLDPNDYVGQIEMLNKAIVDGIITQDDAKRIQDLINSSIAFDENQNIQESLNSFSKKIEDFFKSFEEKGITDIPINIDFDPEKVSKADQKVIDALSKSKAAIEKFNNDVASILENGVENTIGDFAFAIGEALANGENPLKAGGAALLRGLAGILNQLGQMAIGVGITIGAIKKALASLNPVVAIGAGVALIALAGAVSSKAKALSNFGGGSGGSIGSVTGTSASGAPPQIFTNKNTVLPPSSTSPNYQSDYGFDPRNEQGRLIPMFKWDGFYVEWENYNNRRGNG